MVNVPFENLRRAFGLIDNTETIEREVAGKVSDRLSRLTPQKIRKEVREGHLQLVVDKLVEASRITVEAMRKDMGLAADSKKFEDIWGRPTRQIIGRQGIVLSAMTRNGFGDEDIYRIRSGLEQFQGEVEQIQPLLTLDAENMEKKMRSKRK